MPEKVKQSVYGARGFYLVMYVGFYYTVYLYPNSLTLNLRKGEYLTFTLYFILHATSMYFFFTSANNPGYILSDELVGDIEEYSALNKEENNKSSEHIHDQDQGDLELGSIESKPDQNNQE